MRNPFNSERPLATACGALRLMTLPRSELKGADALKSVYLNVVNIVTLCQHEVFFNDENFRQVLTATVQDLIVFAGYSSKSQRLCSIILTAMCNRIAANKHM